MLRKAATMAVCKINIDSDLRLAFTGQVRKHFAEHPDHFDPRQYLTDARDGIQEHGAPQDRGRAGLQRQGLIGTPFLNQHSRPGIFPGRFFYCKIRFNVVYQ